MIGKYYCAIGVEAQIVLLRMRREFLIHAFIERRHRNCYSKRNASPHRLYSALYVIIPNTGNGGNPLPTIYIRCSYILDNSRNILRLFMFINVINVQLIVN